jgi:hypothetical protein
MGRWPLLVARQIDQNDPLNNSQLVADWAKEIVTALEPAISTLPAKIDGLNWK